MIINHMLRFTVAFWQLHKKFYMIINHMLRFTVAFWQLHKKFYMIINHRTSKKKGVVIKTTRQTCLLIQQ
ncbi:hypothetical protein CD113_09025 [Staphylococcus simiae]|nr:hypothetical protein CD113_09025 [Staphylococcus simiae]